MNCIQIFGTPVQFLVACTRCIMVATTIVKQRQDESKKLSLKFLMARLMKIRQKPVRTRPRNLGINPLSETHYTHNETVTDHILIP